MFYNQSNDPYPLLIKINDVSMEREDEYKYLGSTISQKLASKKKQVKVYYKTAREHER